MIITMFTLSNNQYHPLVMNKNIHIIGELQESFAIFKFSYTLESIPDFYNLSYNVGRVETVRHGRFVFMW